MTVGLGPTGLLPITGARVVQPSHRSLHRVADRLEQWNSDDAASADHHRFEGCVVEQEWWLAGRAAVGRVGTHETDAQDAQVTRRVAPGLHVERALRVQLVEFCRHSGRRPSHSCCMQPTRTNVQCYILFYSINLSVTRVLFWIRYIICIMLYNTSASE